MKTRSDNNQREIVNVFRSLVCSVQNISTQRGGCPDLIVGITGKNYLVEIKGKDGKLTPDQIVWHTAWRGQVCILRSSDDAIKLVNEVRG